MSALKCLALGRQKFVVARLIGHEAIEDCLSACDEHHEPGVYIVCKELEAWTEQVIGELRSEESLADYLGALPRVLLGRVHQMHGEVLDSVGTALVGRLEAIEHGQRDLFQEAFEEVVRTSVAFYERCGVPVDTNRLRFELLCQESGSPHDFETHVMTGGRTVRRGAGLRAQIMLTGDSFRFAEARAIPYVLFHEIVVHALAHPAAVESGGKFAEGWMDVVAKQIHDTALADVATRFPRPERTKAWGTAVHDARTAPGTKRKAGRVQGRDAAEGVLRGIRSFAGDDATPIFSTLSAALNRSELSEDDRDELTEILSTGLRDGLPDLAHMAALQRFAAVYKADPPAAAEAFADEILQL